MTAENQKENISLPVIQKKNHSRWRWTVLVFVQILILVHIAVWLIFGGETLTPVEPSEGMEFVKNGVVNAGGIFFLLALLSTLIFGRWFCGWGCHIVLLQDSCLWMLRKIRVRPKPFRSRLLMWFPFALAVYMYIWPLFYRFVLAPWLQPELHWPGITSHLFTEEFWSSFGPPLLAIPFLLICGFATVYVLGAKGFCTYGCPYGGFFKPLDAASRMRVLVDNNCEQCGKCTAACTSNVRVHEEVKRYNMVIDSGCMKIMDCVDACPNNALRIGFRETAIGKRSQQRKYDHSLREEIFIASLFLFGFFSFRGLYATIPMLMAVGASLVITWVVWKAIRTVCDTNTSFNTHQLKYHGEYRKSGVAFLIAAFILFSITLHSAAIQTSKFLGDYALSKNNIDSAMKFYTWASPFEDGGFALASNPNIDIKVAKYYESLLKYKDAERLLRRVDRRVGEDEKSTMLIGQNIQHHEQFVPIESFYKQRLSVHPQWKLVWEDYVGWLKRDGMHEQAIEVSKESIANNPNTIRLQIQLALLEIEYGNVTDAILLATQMTKTFPSVAPPWMLLSRALDASGDHEGARVAQRRAAEIQNEQ